MKTRVFDYTMKLSPKYNELYTLIRSEQRQKNESS